MDLAAIDLTTGCRLHFGLIELAEGQPNRFGGLGLGLDGPGFPLGAHARPSQKSSRRLGDDDAHACTVQLPTDLSHADADEYRRRVEEAFQHCIQNFRQQIHAVGLNERVEPFPVDVHFNFPSLLPLHSGLGSGTQLGVAVAATTAQLLYGVQTPQTLSELAALSGRGLRSAVGLETFLRGGFVFDAGTGASQLRDFHCDRRDLPSAWRVVLVIPTGESPVTGEHETRLLAEIARRRNPGATRMLELCHQLLREMNRKNPDFANFTSLLEEYMRLAAQPFIQVQHGVYNGQRVSDVATTCSQVGLRAVGQSSWGPSVFGFAESDERAEQAVVDIRLAHPDAFTTISKPSRTGAAFRLPQ